MNDVQRMLKDIEREVRLTRTEIGKDALDARVMAAMREVPRHEFIPQELHEHAYDDGPVPIGMGQTISQPYIVALMSDLLNSKASDRILEIGTGSGYQAAVLSRLVRKVYSIEIIERLSQQAQACFDKLGYDNIELKTDDGYYGWPEQAPYDGIIVTAAASEIPQPLIEQLKPGARLVIPVGLPYSYQELIVVEHKLSGEIAAQAILGVSFVPLTGRHQTDGAAKPLP
ncbi:protein-L-isoaspartate(D-aspartate) O-methyltransferase [Methylomarinum sp. Ch1-1]|uniref:Protein-L-isoaspartate O-methyltransferase n=1 Tax=Methylomarinum roseum TaxID=3067653 RepID=A0AAU7NWY4_9GAMM|nr:protein-L-isoaspartate(D-aspartate) O-methyltransferase [Methylomarinum sp. Ch1-1]MDP4522409.1 protein-L-isoaspartate(D-aspartate) O-methyltransferase [Methylomarinum sp. Ch1-1]